MHKSATAGLVGLLAVLGLPGSALAGGGVGTTLTGRDSGAKPDRLLVTTDPVNAGATVKLWRFEDGKRHLGAEGMVDFKGHCRFVVEDLNGKRRTTYVAKVLDSETTALTNRKRVR